MRGGGGDGRRKTGIKWVINRRRHSLHVAQEVMEDGDRLTRSFSIWAVRGGRVESGGVMDIM